MRNKVQQQQAYVLHTRPYRETSLLVELFTKDHGRISGVARGVRSPRSKQRGLLQAFMPIMLSWSGRSDLVTLYDVQGNGMPHLLFGRKLISGLYMNELMMKLLHRPEPQPQLYQLYSATLNNLQNAAKEETILRLFEKHLLIELGYALELENDIDNNETISAECYYHFEPQRGPFRIEQPANQSLHHSVFIGASLIALRDEDFASKQCLSDAKRLLRQAIAVLLGEKKIRSRELWIVA